ncbi:Holliday junction resolvase RuvX [Psychrobacter sp. YP14]|jgi:putative Holliday junction resolvase|uniref:Putative pre-16S rRNA nuclease n=2 Tax=Psychrobacter TaxID=497 RepID=YQGF_PSYWF|nr:MULTISPECIES: Holliday junction resolvase RuvX [Psychrobacter]A5WBR2.1 RecName: Full=Putative pre-16S rRNA nuclease [Psychrobacter sp. PRwf-1]AWT48202.1 Holliday junction resolvase RuvX [Psychrobacter sp. YP14]MUG31670.1 Holliday junction resolvase RuvX [Psychrobacter sanguinis]
MLNDASNKENANSDVAADAAARPEQTVLLGLDYGVKKMGMALGNTVTQDARPFDILAMNNGQPADWDNLLGIIDTWRIGRVVVGLPLNMDGSSSMIAKRAHKFARRLAHRLMEQRIHVPVQLFDERLTSVEAREMAWELGLIKNERDPIDDISACLLLQSYLANPDHAEDIATYKAD